MQALEGQGNAGGGTDLRNARERHVHRPETIRGTGAVTVHAKQNTPRLSPGPQPPLGISHPSARRSPWEGGGETVTK